MLTQDSLPFISGMGYRKKCDLIFDEFDKFDINIVNQFDGMKIFVKTDLLLEFISNVLPKIKNNFNLYTHNSDFGIDNKYLPLLNNSKLINWFAQNVLIKHNKLVSIPIGLANQRWPHGNIKTLNKVISEANTKDNLLYINFDINTNVQERTFCLNNINPYTMDTKKPFEEYLRCLSKSYFVVSPNGNGIDCHKHWEALYLKTIPIVTKSVNIDNFKNYPFLVINSWADFKSLHLTKDLYNNIYDKSNYNLFI